MRATGEALDATDPLRSFRDRFLISDPDLCYLDGNSLGRLPLATAARLRQVVEEEWGGDLVGGWDRWIDLPQQVGDVIAPLVGAPPGTVVVADSTTVNLHALVDAACAARPERRVLVIADGEFPTDRYVVAGIAAARALEVRVVASDPLDGPDPAAIIEACAPNDVAVVVASAVDFRSGALLDVTSVVAGAQRHGAWVCLDLSHAVGVVPIDLAGLGAELAVGCTYKHLCGGPGAPAFLYARADLRPRLRRPQWGWFAQREQFAMGPRHDPDDGPRRFLAGTPAVLGLVAVEQGATLVAEAGIAAVRAKSVALTSFAVAAFDEVLAPAGFTLASPRDPGRLGAHISVAHPEAVAVGLAARAAGVVPDVRPPDRLRFGLSPLSTSFVEVEGGTQRIADLVGAGDHHRYRAVSARIT